MKTKILPLSPWCVWLASGTIMSARGVIKGGRLARSPLTRHSPLTTPPSTRFCSSFLPLPPPSHPETRSDSKPGSVEEDDQWWPESHTPMKRSRSSLRQQAREAAAMRLLTSYSTPPMPTTGAGAAARCVARGTHIQSSYAPQNLIGATNNWSSERMNLLRRTGLGGLLQLRHIGNVDRQRALWLLSRIDPDTMLLDAGDDVFVPIDARACARVLGLEEGGIRIPLGKPPSRPAALTRVLALLSTGIARSSNVPAQRVLAILEEAMVGEVDATRERKLLAAYTLYAGAVFLAPRPTSARVPDELLPVVENPDRIAEFDFCNLVVDVLHEGARAIREALPHHPSNVVLLGCLMVPLLLFLDAKEHGVDALESLPGPRIAIYGSSLMKTMLAKHFPTHFFLGGMLAIGGDEAAQNPLPRPHAAPASPDLGAGSSSHPADGASDARRRLNAQITRAAAAALSLTLERTKLGDDKDLECMQESFRILDLQKKAKMEEIANMASERRQKELEEMLDMFVAEILHLLSYGPGTDGAEWWRNASERFLSLPPGDQGREDMVAMARTTASAIQRTAISNLNIQTGAHIESGMEGNNGEPGAPTSEGTIYRRMTDMLMLGLAWKPAMVSLRWFQSKHLAAATIMVGVQCRHPCLWPLGVRQLNIAAMIVLQMILQAAVMMILLMWTTVISPGMQTTIRFLQIMKLLARSDGCQLTVQDAT
ncbi:uncharacterized protein [Triticum aestivum]|uniref:uncharacterized protein isoform X2 n=1 Tax=Triticum aestivum TaxID=4565 RepID=UPI001D02A191|nr:uncharacterized protein LOC123103224 isoform X2 [Triticum aestivum]